MNCNKNYSATVANFIMFTIIVLILIHWTRDLKNKKIKNHDIMKVTGLVLARCGSKGIPRKNVALLNGTSLLQNVLKVMEEFGKFDNIWVSTDCQEIANNVEELSSNVKIHWRESYTASDSASSLIAVKEFCRKHTEVEAIGLIQCTSPFIKKIWLEKAYKMILSQKYDSVFSVVRQHKLLWESLEDGTVKPVNFDINNRPRRQDWNGFLVETGMFYFMTTEVIKNNLLQGGRIGIVEVPSSHSLEIDTEFDLKLAGKIMSIIN